MNLLKNYFFLAILAILASTPILRPSQTNSASTSNSTSAISSTISRQGHVIPVSLAQILSRQNSIPISIAQPFGPVLTNLPQLDPQLWNRLANESADRHNYRLGMIFYSKQRYGAALNCFTLADEGSYAGVPVSGTFPCALAAIRLGEIYSEGLGVTADIQKATNYLNKASKVADALIREMAARGLGSIYYKQKEYKKAYASFEEALKLAPRQTTPLEDLIFKFPDPAIKLAEMNLYGLGIAENLAKTYRYLTMAFQRNSKTTKNAAAALFYQMKQLILHRFTAAVELALNSPSLQTILQAGKIERELLKIESKYLDKSLNAVLEKEIDENSKKFKDIKTRYLEAEAASKKRQVAQSTQTNTIAERKEQSTKSNSAEAEVTQNTETVYQLADLESAMSAARAKQEYFLKKPSSDERYREVSSALAKAQQIARILSNQNAIEIIKEKINEMETVRQQAQTEQVDSKEEKKNITTTNVPFAILDPFNCTQNQSSAIRARLQELITNPQHVSQSEKLNVLSQTWSTRIGRGDRMLYIVLPNYHSVGIINIGPHKDYEKEKELQHREAWFLKPNAIEILKKIEQAEQSKNQEQAQALQAFLLQAEILHQLILPEKHKA